MVRISLFIVFICISQLLGKDSDQIYEFKGQHLIASYLGCDRAKLLDTKGLAKIVKEASFATGATIIEESVHRFSSGGFSMVILLSESHSSIHTYPEYDGCFIDIFTCGDSCQVEAFDRVLQGYLKPKKVSKKILLRDKDIKSIY